MLRATSRATKPPNKVIQATTPQDLPGSREYPIYHKPGSIAINSVEDLIKLYPNSSDRLGSLKGEYDIKVDPTVPPVQHARRKVPIESKAAIKEAIDYMGIWRHADQTNTMGILCHLSSQAIGWSKALLGCKGPE